MKLFLFLGLLCVNSVCNSADLVNLSEHNQAIIRLNASNEEQQKQCLATAIYFEASHRNTTQEAVANTILNRTLSKLYPKTVCGVISQKTIYSSSKKVCQFSYMCESKKKIDENSKRWEDAQQISQRLLSDFLSNSRTDNTKGATHFHDNRVKPTWSTVLRPTLITNQMRFYK